MKKKCSSFLILFLMMLSAISIHAQDTKDAKETKSYHWYNSPPNFVKPFNSPDAKKLPLIEVKGNKLVNEKGDTVLFRGLSISDPDKLDGEGHWSKEYFTKVKEMGAMIVRIPIHPVAWRETTPQKYLQLLDQAVEWCTELNMYVIIDWHSIGNLEMGLFQDPSYNTSKTETFEFWRTIAAHFKGNNTVAFYEIFNEPTTYFGLLGRATWEEWKKFNEDVIALMRAYDKETIPLVAPFDWAYDLTPILVDPINAERIAYVTHPYPNKRKQLWEPRWEENFAFAAGKYPVIATEFGFGHFITGKDDDSDNYGNRIISFLEDKGISWVMWVFDAEWGPRMLESWKDYKLTPYGEFVKKALHGEVVKSKVEK